MQISNNRLQSNNNLQLYQAQAQKKMYEGLLQTLEEENAVWGTSDFYTSYGKHFDKASTRRQDEARKSFAPALQFIFSARVAPLISPTSSVLEIGADVDESCPGSYLSEKFPEFKDNWTYSDRELDPTAIPQKILALDLLNNKQTTKNKFDVVIGNSTLDTIKYSKLTTAFEAIRGQLKENGLFIHTADLNFFYDAFSDHLNGDKDKVFLPLFHPSKIGCVSKDKFQEILKNNLLSAEEKKFYASWLKCKLQASFIQRREYPEELLPWFAKIQFLFAKEMEEISLQNTFQKELKNAAVAAGFEVVDCKYYRSVIALESADKKVRNNYILLSEGTFFQERLYVIHPERVLISADLHLFVARPKALAAS